jgi:hypothetical protein
MSVVGAIIAGVSLAVSAASYFLYSPQENNQTDMAAANLDAFSITSVEEGKVIPRAFGRCRLPGNILWYGNLKSKAQYQEVEGGKGSGGSSKSKTGYKYWMDMWQGVCVGPATPMRVYVQDEPYEWDEWIVDVDAQVNGGYDHTYPTAPGAYASSLPGVCHVWLPQFYLGYNVSTVPTIHWVMDCYPPTPVDHAQLGNGANPAAIIYTLLTDAGAPTDRIDLSSFNAAAAYWANQGYGLNLSFTKQAKAREHIAEVLKYVGGRFVERSDGMFALRADDPNQALAGSVTDREIISLDFERATWEDSPNVFEGKYSDEAQELTTRTAAPARNTASISLIGREVRESVDLSAFRDPDTANKRLWEIMKRESYPAASMTLTTNLSFVDVEPGDVLEVSSERDGISATCGVITSKDLSELDKNEVKFSLTEAVGRVVDGHWTAPPAPAPWTPPIAAPKPLSHVRVLELPRNSETGTAPTVMVLAARELGYEDGLALLSSGTGTDFTLLQTSDVWTQHGTLNKAYPANTYAVDDSVGIVYTPTREDPVFSSVSRSDLFATRRFAVIDDEIMRFQSVELLDGGAIRLSGIVRGIYNTPIQDHAAAAEIWICEPGNNVIGLETDCSLLFLPSVLNSQLARDEVIALPVEISGRAAVPPDVARIRAVRSGSKISLSWWPVDAGLGGAGEAPPARALDQWPPEFNGDFLVNDQAVAACETTIQNTEATAITIRARQSGQISPGKTIAVPALDGEYIA